MYEVLAYVYETFWGGEDCPGRDQLGRRLCTAGFEREEVQSALAWLDGLNTAAQSLSAAAVEWPATTTVDGPHPDSQRIYTERELAHLGRDGVACLHFLEQAGALPMELRELVIDRALAVSESPMALDELKVIVMMVYWRTGTEPDVLVLDELCDNAGERLAH